MANLHLRLALVVCAVVVVAVLLQSVPVLALIIATFALAIAWYALWLNSRLVNEIDGFADALDDRHVGELKERGKLVRAIEQFGLRIEFDMTVHDKRMAALRRWIDQHEGRLVLVEKQLNMESNEPVPRVQEYKPSDKEVRRGTWIVDGIVTNEPPDRDSYGNR